MRRLRSKPDTFLPHVVLRAVRAAVTATSMSFLEPTCVNARESMMVEITLPDRVLASYNGADGLLRGGIDAPAYADVHEMRCRLSMVCQSWTYRIVSFQSTDGTNLLLIKRPVGKETFLPVAGIVISTTGATMVVVVEERDEREIESDVRRACEPESLIKIDDKDGGLAGRLKERIASLER